MTTAGYLRYPHIHGDLITFTAEDDVWLAPATGGRAWKLSADGAGVSYPRFSPSGHKVAWTSWRDRDPEVYTIDAEGGGAGRLTYWGDLQTRTAGWLSDTEVLAISAVGQPARQAGLEFLGLFGLVGHCVAYISDGHPTATPSESW